MKKADWSKVDWSKHDALIAQNLGVSRVAVGRMRKRKGIDKAKKSRKEKPASTKANSMLLAGSILGWSRLGVEEYLPVWAKPQFEEMYDLAKKIIKSKQEGVK